MSKIDLLKEKKQLPKPQTIQFLLNFSRSFQIVKTAQMKATVFKN